MCTFSDICIKKNTNEIENIETNSPKIIQVYVVLGKFLNSFKDYVCSSSKTN